MIALHGHASLPSDELCHRLSDLRGDQLAVLAILTKLSLGKFQVIYMTASFVDLISGCPII